MMAGTGNSRTPTGAGRGQAALLTAVAVLLAADIFVRLEPPAANASLEVQPDREVREVPTLINPAQQRASMINELKELRRSVASLERKLDTRIKVEVTNFPKPEPSGE
ncbi:MAG: hypothetical protein ACTS22_06065 [Phycisphaerales bacterium]